MYDFHLHSDYSMDSKSPMEKMVYSAIEKNLKSICFTDHIDLEATSQKIDFQFRIEDYFREIKKVKYKYINNIEILSGVEIGMQPHLKVKYDNIIENNPFDFVIMSIHGVNGKSIAIDRLFEKTSPKEVLDLYYNEMYKCVKIFDNFDVLGHLDYVDRYISNPDNLPDYKMYYDIITEILKIVIEKGKGVELNTAGLRHGLSYPNPKPSILKLYKDLGGEIITIGSDAHSPEYLGYNYKLGEKLLKELGFKHIYLFKNRKKFPINID